MRDAFFAERYVDAYRVVFGTRSVTDEQLRRLTLTELKSSYRALAKQLHPDRAAAHGASETELTQRFQRVSAAYEVLKQLLSTPPRLPLSATPRAAPTAATRPAPSPHARPSAQASASHAGPPPRAAWRDAPPPAGATPAHDPYWRGPLPKRRLLFAEHLYYSGRISWQQLIDALVWQSRERPRFGSLAVQYGLLSPATVRDLMSARHSSERIGECAVRLGRLRDTQRDYLVSLQQTRSRRVGTFFIESSILGLPELARAAAEQHRHNAQHAA